MKSWPETLQFAIPLRDVRLAGSPVLPTPVVDARPDPELLRQSYEQGRQDGENALSERLLQQRADMHALSEGFLAALNGSVPQVVRDTESLLISLALSVAQKLVADLPISAPMIEAAIHDALAQVEGTAQFTIRLNQADLELLQKVESPMLASSDGIREFTFVAGPEVTRGGCLVQTRFGTVDARRETKFDLLKRSLLA